MIIKFSHRDHDFKVEESDEEIIFVDTTRIEFRKIVQKFGHLLKNLKITPSDDHDVNYSDLFKEISLYCSKWLTVHIEMSNDIGSEATNSVYVNELNSQLSKEWIITKKINRHGDDICYLNRRN